MLSSKHFLLGGARCTATSVDRGLCESSILAILVVFCGRNRPGQKRFRDVSCGVSRGHSCCSLRRTLRIASIRACDNAPAPTHPPSRAFVPDAKKWSGSRRSNPPTDRNAPPVCFLCPERGNGSDGNVRAWYGQRSVNPPPKWRHFEATAIFWRDSHLSSDTTELEM